MEKLAQRFRPSSKHFKNSGEVTYLISPLKERIPAALLPDREKETPEGRFLSIREKTMAICKPLYVEDFVPRHHSFKSIKWHLMHTTYLLEKELLSTFVGKYRSFHEKFDRFFEAMENNEKGVDFSRPSLDSIIAYRNHVDERVDALLKGAKEAQREEILYHLDFILALEKDSQEEILSQIKIRFFENEMAASYWPHEEEQARKSKTGLGREKWIEFEGGLVNIGSEGKQFAHDMEMPRHTVYIRPFAMSQRVVTNGDFLQFIEEEGYQRGGLWLAEGWKEVQEKQLKMPKYWKKDGSKIEQYTLTGLKPLKLNEPLSHITFFEADAYARFAGARLPSEMEWEFASESISSVRGNFLTEGKFHPTVISDEDLRISSKLKGMFGDVWEWTTSLYAPYPGYVASQSRFWKYTGRLEGSKRVLKGGSCLYDGLGFRRTMRKPLSINQSSFCTGLRLVKNL